MRYIGLDLSTVSSGYSVFENDKLIEYGAIVPKDTDVMNRIEEVTIKIENIITAHMPDKVIIEDTFYGANYLTTKLLNRLAGAVYYAVKTIKDVPIIFVTPTGARKVFGILPSSTKKNIVDAVNKKFDKDFELKENDVTDAIVLGWYGWYQDNNPNEFLKKTEKDFFTQKINSKLRVGKPGQKPRRKTK